MVAHEQWHISTTTDVAVVFAAAIAIYIQLTEYRTPPSHARDDLLAARLH
jgi:hypothetical protein